MVKEERLFGRYITYKRTPGIDMEGLARSSRFRFLYNITAVDGTIANEGKKIRDAIKNLEEYIKKMQERNAKEMQTISRGGSTPFPHPGGRSSGSQRTFTMKKKIPASPPISLQQEKVEALWEFVAISETLYQCLLARDFVEIARQLEKRENLVHSIDEIDRRILQASSGPSQDGLGGTPEPDEDSVVLHNLKTLLREAADLNAQCLAQAALLQEEFKRESATTREGRIAARRFLQQAGSSPRFMGVRL